MRTFPAECLGDYSTSIRKPQSNLRTLSPEMCRQSFYNLTAICGVWYKPPQSSKWYWDEMTHFCNRDKWVFKYACLLLALLVSICGHSYSSTCANIYGAWPPLTCAEARCVSFSLCSSGKHLQIIQDTLLKQLEQLLVLQHPHLVQVWLSPFVSVPPHKNQTVSQGCSCPKATQSHPWASCHSCELEAVQPLAWGTQHPTLWSGS